MDYLDKKELKKLDDLFIKLNKLYKGCYLCITGYVVNIQNLDTPVGFGKIIAELNEVQLDIIKKIFDNNPTVGFIKIEDIKEARNNLDLLIFKITQDEKDYINNEIDILNNNLNKISKWNDFIIDKDDEENNTLIIDNFFNKNVSIDLDTDIGPIMISKHILPNVSMKNYADNLAYSTININDEVSLLIFEFQFTHFKMYISYYILPLELILKNNTVNE